MEVEGSETHHGMKRHETTGSAGILPASCAHEKLADRDAGAPSDAGPGHSLAPSFIPAHKETSRVMTNALSPEPHRGWHSRGYLPHWDHPGMIQGVTFRLHDSVPKEVIDRWKAELATGSAGILPARPKANNAAKDGGDPSEFDPRLIELHKRITRYEDEGHGACMLRNERIGRLVENALLHFDGHRYRLLAWCVMPNHVHALIETREGWPLAGVLHSWKSYAANQANRLLARRGEFWHREYYDRYIRNAEHYVQAVRYVEDNPVKAGLVKRTSDWPFTSAKYRHATGSAGILPARSAGEEAKRHNAP